MKHSRIALTYSDTICRILILSLLISLSGCSYRSASSSDLALDHLMQGDGDRNKGNYSAALQEYQTAISVSPNDWPGHYKAGQMLEQKGRFQEAIAEYRKVIVIDHMLRNPADKAWWHFRLAGALHKAGLNQEAVLEYKTSYRIASQDQLHKKKIALLAKQSLILSKAEDRISP